MQLKSISQPISNESLIFITDKSTKWEALPLTDTQKDYIQQQLEKEVHAILFNHYDGTITLIAHFKAAENAHKNAENCRLAGCEASLVFNKLKIGSVSLVNKSGHQNAALDFAEGMALRNYQFLKYFNKKEKNTLNTVNITQADASSDAVQELQNVVNAVYAARTLVNEPLMFLTAPQLSKEIEKMSQDANFKLTVFDKSKIEAEKMGGILAVNYGSIDEPRFNILEWKPENATNEKPIILVGKGVVYDTGGLSLKGTANSMDHMKCDMAGAAAVACTLYAVAKNKLPLHVIGLIPSTDNRPGLNAYVPGDVINMHSGATVEVLNTDAEGRMLLADALSYAQRYEPQLVIDLATLTGSALVAIGQQGMVMMSNANETTKSTIKASGYETHERLAELPLWEEYKEQLKSDIADVKNVGGRMAGSITAGKFLEHFTDYPWIHIDMAMAWNYQQMGYRAKNGSGVGVRLLYNFLKKHIPENV